jgi:hypothetical protein
VIKTCSSLDMTTPDLYMTRACISFDSDSCVFENCINPCTIVNCISLERLSLCFITELHEIRLVIVL